MTARRLRRRLVITLDSAEFDTAELERITRLAQRLDAELEVVFVEDADVLRLAELPFLQEFRPNSMRLEQVSAERMERELQASARRAERELARITREHGISWQFRVWRGSLEQELLGAMEADILALSWLGALHMPRQRPRRQPGVAVWFDGSPATERALETAGALASEPQVPLTVLLCGSDRDSRNALRQRATEILPALRPPPEYVALPEADIAAIAHALHNSASALLVLGRDNRLLQSGSLRDALRRLGCSLFLVS